MQLTDRGEIESVPTHPRSSGKAVHRCGEGHEARVFRLRRSWHIDAAPTMVEDGRPEDARDERGSRRRHDYTAKSVREACEKCGVLRCASLVVHC